MCYSMLHGIIRRKKMEYAAEALSQLGFSYFPSEHEKIRKKASSILSMSKYMLERINA